jgi:antitoxin VapB
MVQLSQETEALARRLAAAQGVSMEDAIRRAIEQKAREAGIADQPRPGRDLSAKAVAERKARIERVVQEIATMPVLDPRSPREIMDDFNAL